MTMENKYILIVDDNPGICRLLSEVLSNAGYSTEIAINGEKAISIICTSIPLLIFLDIKMPGMNGIETLERIRQIIPSVPVVVMTAYSETHLVDESVRRGLVKHYINKPFDIYELLYLVENIINDKIIYDIV